MNSPEHTWHRVLLTLFRCALIAPATLFFGFFLLFLLWGMLFLDYHWTENTPLHLWILTGLFGLAGLWIAVLSCGTLVPTLFICIGFISGAPTALVTIPGTLVVVLKTISGGGSANDIWVFSLCVSHLACLWLGWSFVSQRESSVISAQPSAQADGPASGGSTA